MHPGAFSFTQPLLDGVVEPEDPSPASTDSVIPGAASSRRVYAAMSIPIRVNVNRSPSIRVDSGAGQDAGRLQAARVFHNGCDFSIVQPRNDAL